MFTQKNCYSIVNPKKKTKNKTTRIINQLKMQNKKYQLVKMSTTIVASFTAPSLFHFHRPQTVEHCV